MIQVLLFIVLAFSIHQPLGAQKIEPQSELNSILFSIGQQSWTLRDQQVYQAVLTEVFKLKKISPHTNSNEEDFLVSRLSEKEASLFDLSYEKIKLTEAQKRKLNLYSDREISLELENIAQALAMLQLKETQLKEPVRFKAWTESLKRKYQLKIKSGTRSF